MMAKNYTVDISSQSFRFHVTAAEIRLVIQKLCLSKIFRGVVVIMERKE